MGELTIAKSAGFCFGVTRAVNMVYEAIEKEANIKKKQKNMWILLQEKLPRL